jgi:hypothetical protein
MGSHPNVILQCNLTPNDLSRKTYRDILKEMKGKEEDDLTSTIKIGDEEYHIKVMEESYDADGMQIAAKVGDIAVWDLVTYGFGEQITWEKLASAKAALERFAVLMCQKFNCDYKIVVTANFW